MTDNSSHPKNQDDLQALTALNPTDVRMAAMNLLARREHSRRELRKKLRGRFSGFENHTDIVEEQIDQLAQENLQSDERFARSYVRMRAGRGYGPARIGQELRERGLSDEEVVVAFEALEESWFDLAWAAFEKKFGAAPPQDIKERARRARFMQYRGFAREHIDHCEQYLVS